ncbi:MAG: hypothetical protein A2Y79_02985 [Deltaproteobacteria bacterium RBG_13_43_22]|nr:MAG: hypothetical protein A2Y79_02985 [Deltaproteobacteria bacterium RBG_13_43_22]
MRRGLRSYFPEWPVKALKYLALSFSYRLQNTPAGYSPEEGRRFFSPRQKEKIRTQSKKG